VNDSKESATFFDHGKVEILDHEFRTREAQFRITVPCCLFLAATPQLLAHGLIDEFSVHHPVSIWIPSLTQDRFHPAIVEQIPLVAEKANAALRQTAERTAQNFEDLIQYMPFPDDLIPTLPLGVYIEFKYRCRVDDVAKILIGMQQTVHHGIAEFRYALAQVLHCALQDVDRWESGRRTLSR